jgi:diketogulonate reductase-like aldo/keto reductase
MQDKQAFIDVVMVLVETQGLTYMEAVIEWCARHSIEIEAVAPLIKKNKSLKLLVKKEAEDLNFIKKTGARLPV